MMFLSRLLGSSHSRYALIFDVGSATVGGTIAYYRAKQPPEMLFAVRNRILFSGKRGIDSLASALADTLHKTAEDLLAGMGSTGQTITMPPIYVVVHAPWSYSRSHSAEGKLTHPTRITKKLLQQFIAKHLIIEPPEEHMQFDQHVMRVELNDYPTTDPYGKIASKIGVTMLANTMPRIVYEELTSMLTNVFPNHTLHIEAFVDSVTDIPGLFSDQSVFTFIDISGEYTAVSIIRDDTIAATASGNFGTEHLVRALAGDEPDADNAARSLLSMYITNTCTPAQARTVEQKLAGVEGAWTSVFTGICQELSSEGKMPTRAFIASDEKLASWFARAIEHGDFSSFTITGRPFSVEILSDQHLPHPVRIGSGVTRDTMLALSTLFVDK